MFFEAKAGIDRELLGIGNERSQENLDFGRYLVVEPRRILIRDTTDVVELHPGTPLRNPGHSMPADRVLPPSKCGSTFFRGKIQPSGTAGRDQWPVRASLRARQLNAHRAG